MQSGPAVPSPLPAVGSPGPGEAPQCSHLLSAGATLRSCCTGGLTHPMQSKQDSGHLQHSASSDEGGPHSWDKVCLITGETVVLPLYPGRMWVTAGDLLGSYRSASCHSNFSPLCICPGFETAKVTVTPVGSTNPAREIMVYNNLLEPKY